MKPRDLLKLWAVILAVPLVMCWFWPPETALVTAIILNGLFLAAKPILEGE